jgi:hypothetical protein
LQNGNDASWRLPIWQFNRSSDKRIWKPPLLNHDATVPGGQGYLFGGADIEVALNKSLAVLAPPALGDGLGCKYR